MIENAEHLPHFLEPLLAEQYRYADIQRILEGYEAQRTVTLRANALLSNRDEIAESLDDENIEWDGVEWYSDAFVLNHAREKDIWNLPIYQQGKVYLQSLSSMLPALILDAHAGEDILDMCAAPGGKTTQIAALTAGGAYITACELHTPRAEKLDCNLHKLGARNVTVMRTDARRLDSFFAFDRILLDAPCSGSGTVQSNNPKSFKQLSPRLIEKSVKAQRALIDKALTLLKPGGTLVYSTCSILSRENEEIIEWALEKPKTLEKFEIEPIELDGGEALPLLPTTIGGTLCLAPTALYEGFFVAKISRKPRKQ